MGRWIEIRAHRIYAVEEREWRTGLYQTFNEEGNPTKEGEPIYRVVRTTDGKVFNIARFWPSEYFVDSVRYLEEI